MVNLVLTPSGFHQTKNTPLGVSVFVIGGAKGARAPDLFAASEALSQLSNDFVFKRIFSSKKLQVACGYEERDVHGAKGSLGFGLFDMKHLLQQQLYLFLRKDR